MLTFYNNDFNPYGQRVWIALLEKGISHEHVEVNLFDKPKAFLDVVPNGVLPTLVHDGHVLQESIDLCRFVDDLAPETPLLPASPREKHAANGLLRRFAEPAFGKVYDVLSAKGDEARAKKLVDLRVFLQGMAEALKSRGGPFFLGERFTIPDLAVFPFLERARVLVGHHRGLDFTSEDEFDAVRRFYEACASRASVARTIAPRSEASLRTHPFDETERAPYLIAVSHGYVDGNIDEVRARLCQKKPPLAD
jgi:glutathione S-transferase